MRLQSILIYTSLKPFSHISAMNVRVCVDLFAQVLIHSSIHTYYNVLFIIKRNNIYWHLSLLSVSNKVKCAGCNLYVSVCLRKQCDISDGVSWYLSMKLFYEMNNK